MGFTLLRELRNHGAQSLLPEVAFSPDGATFAASVQEQNEVRLHDTASGACLRTWSNPEAGFGEPHGLVLTERHLLVSNRHYFSAPSDIRVYRLAAADDRPVDCLTTPFPDLVEAHSLALSRGRQRPRARRGCPPGPARQPSQAAADPRKRPGLLHHR